MYNEVSIKKKRCISNKLLTEEFAVREI